MENILAPPKSKEVEIMKIVRNNIIPFKGFKALTLWPLVFVRKDAVMRDRDMRHEAIHGRQQKELLVVLFLVWYGLEWLIRLVIYRSTHKAYRMISFEQEAYQNEHDDDYLTTRRWYAWTKYIFKL